MTTSSRTKIGLIGAGWWATANHLPVLVERDDIDLASVCRLGADELQQVKEKFGFTHATQDYRELLETPGLKGVIVASPHTLHYEHALAALKKGLHVMCEKPLTTRADQARELVEEADKQGVELMIPYGWHYGEFIQEAKRRMDDGAVGQIEFVMCHMASPVRSLLEGKQFLSTGGGAGEIMFEPAADTWADPVIAGGGYALAQMSHSAGLAFWLTGLAAESVVALTSAPTSKVELYDSFSVRFAGGAIGSFSGAGALPDNQKFQLDVRIFGSEGSMNVDCDRARLEVLRHDGTNFSMDLPADAGEYFGGGPTSGFADIVTGKSKTNWSPGWAGMRAVEMIDAAYRSVESGKSETV
ncbi:MAG: oxidoreductase [Dehalococcoidia bacterium]|jgi:predicted dehydrogenase|nr:oxidoreductase [Dehalococcoidia bacterium]MEE2841771.1 Gfo/Idh/MocA family oxidoreductase [Chloroflexota bacterium]